MRKQVRVVNIGMRSVFQGLKFKADYLQGCILRLSIFCLICLVCLILFIFCLVFWVIFSLS